jgi:hypothetical protein
MACALTALVAIGVNAEPVQTTIPQVNGGAFTIRKGESADLLGRGIILNVVRVVVGSDGTARSVIFKINGGGASYGIGVRRDLKKDRRTRDFVKDMGACFVDLVGASAIKGAPPSATFQLLCQ